jgi:hypothetical protein
MNHLVSDGVLMNQHKLTKELISDFCEKSLIFINEKDFSEYSLRLFMEII